MFGKKKQEIGIADGVISNTEKKDSKKNLNFYILVGVGVAVVIFIFVISSMLKKTKNTGIDFYDTLNKIASQEVGTFEYVISVNTSESSNRVVTEKLDEKDASIAELNNAESDVNKQKEVNKNAAKDITRMDKDSEDSNYHKFAQWGDTVLSYWEFPTYQIKISGYTSSIEPMNAKINVAISTETYANDFTQIIVVDDVCYVDIYMMKSWLENCGESYLVELSKELTDEATYAVINPEDYAMYSNFAEDGELELSATHSIQTDIRRTHTCMQYLVYLMKNYIGYDCITSSDSNAKMQIDSNKGKTVTNAIMQNVFDYKTFYDNLTYAFFNNQIMSESQLKQATRELDNRDEALKGLRSKLMTSSLEDIGFVMNAEVYSGITSYNNSENSAKFKMQFVLDDKYYNIEISLLKNGDTFKVEAPTQGKSISVKKLKDRYIQESLTKTLEYFDVFDIDFAKSLEVTPTTMREDLLQDLCDLVNELQINDTYLTLRNVLPYIAEYKDYVNENDANHLVVNDFINMVGELSYDVGVKEEQKVVDTQNLTQNFVLNGIDITLIYSEDESNSRLKVWKGLAFRTDELNESNEEEFDYDMTSKTPYTLQLTEFNLKTLLNSMYPANSRLLLQSYGGNAFDMNNAKESIDLRNREAIQFKLYFVTDEDISQMNLYYGDEFVCQLVNY